MKIAVPTTVGLTAAQAKAIALNPRAKRASLIQTVARELVQRIPVKFARSILVVVHGDH